MKHDVSWTEVIRNLTKDVPRDCPDPAIAYLEIIRDKPFPVSVKEEELLIQRAIENEITSKIVLAESNLRNVVSTAKWFFNECESENVTFLELIDAGNLGLIEALGNVTQSVATQFQKHITEYVSASIIQMLAKLLTADSLKRVENSFFATRHIDDMPRARKAFAI